MAQTLNQQGTSKVLPMAFQTIMAKGKSETAQGKPDVSYSPLNFKLDQFGKRTTTDNCLNVHWKLFADQKPANSTFKF